MSYRNSVRHDEMVKLVAALRKAAPDGLEVKPHPNNPEFTFIVPVGDDYNEVDVRATTSYVGWRPEQHSYTGVAIEARGLYRGRSKRNFPISQKGTLNEKKIWECIQEFVDAFKQKAEGEKAAKHRVEKRRDRSFEIVKAAGLSKSKKTVAVQIDDSGRGIITRLSVTPEHPRVEIGTYEGVEGVALKAQGHFSKERIQALIARLGDEATVTLEIQGTLPEADVQAILKEVFFDHEG